MKIRKSKKGVDISVNIIIVAALALIVLVIMVLVFTGRMTLFGKELSAETEKKPCPAGYDAQPTVDCAATDQLLGRYDVPAGSVCCKQA